jgi:tetratricopeptide (TPR) repeat protein
MATKSTTKGNHVMNKDTALKMAIEALEQAEQMSLSEYSRSGDYDEAINACEEALESQEQEPVAWYWDDKIREGKPYVSVLRGNTKLDKVFGIPIPLYTHPAQPLSEERVMEIYKNYQRGYYEEDYRNFARAIEQAHKIGVKDE